jgi:hypothetical protein
MGRWVSMGILGDFGAEVFQRYRDVAKYNGLETYRGVSVVSDMQMRWVNPFDFEMYAAARVCDIIQRVWMRDRSVAGKS